MTFNRIALLALALYPLGIPAIYAALLFSARRALIDSKPTPLSNSLSFLHAEYRPRFFWWELLREAANLSVTTFL